MEEAEAPEIPAQNFRITDDHLGEGGPKEKYQRNVAAIRLLRTLEEENRNATPEEQSVLSQYVGWGGLADAFDDRKDNWSREYDELKELLTSEEYEMARASTLNAHYTSPTVIRAIYEAVGQMGFAKGNILEPAMGVGNFFGMLPEEMQESRLYGVELDSISGRIARKLYPNADITVGGFENTDHRDFYDLAIGNVPFGNYRVADKPYDKLGFTIHNYFFAKALDQVRPGGVVAFVTSRYTMDQQSPDVRKYLAERAELLGAIRLPNNAFRANAGTDVVSDIIFLQKRDRPIDIEPDWVHLGLTPDGLPINNYFAEHPEMVLGEISSESTQYGKEALTVNPVPGANLADQLEEAISHIHGEITVPEMSLEDETEAIDAIPADPSVKNYSYALVGGEVYFRENSLMRHVELSDKEKERMTGLLSLRKIMNELIEYQLEDYPEEMITAKQRELNAAYDSFTETYGIINSRANARAFEEDSSYYLLCSLENLNDDGTLESKADMFTKRTIRPETRITSVETPSEALAVSIGERGKVDLPFMAELLGTPGEYDEIEADLRGVIFRNPLTSATRPEQGWETADEYLSGDVRSKLQTAAYVAESHPEYQVNVEALKKAQPKDLDASEIDIRLGATWIDPDYINQFMWETFGTPFYLKRSIQVSEREKRTVYPKRHTIREELRSVLDDLIQNKPKDWEDYLRLLREEGYEIKRGKHLALKGRAQKKFIRLDSLGEGYSESELREKVIHAGTRHTKREAASPAVDLLIDIQNRALGKGVGYEIWAKKHNLKETAKTLLFLQQHNIHSYEELEKAVQMTVDGSDSLLASIREKDARIKEIDALKQHIFNYSKTHQIYLEYKRLPKGKKDAFYEAHRAELELHEAAKNAFDALPEGTKLPTIKELNAERKRLVEERKAEYEQYRPLRDQKKDFLRAKQNADMILRRQQEERDERPREK